MSQVYAWGSAIYLLLEVFQLLTITFHWLIHMCILGALQNMITPSSMFQGGSWLEHFIGGGGGKYYYVNNIMNLMERSSKRD